MRHNKAAKAGATVTFGHTPVFLADQSYERKSGCYRVQRSLSKFKLDITLIYIALINTDVTHRHCWR